MFCALLGPCVFDLVADMLVPLGVTVGMVSDFEENKSFNDGIDAMRRACGQEKRPSAFLRKSLGVCGFL